MIAQLKHITEATSVPGINDGLRDEILKRSHYISRFENGAIREMVAPYHLAKQNIQQSISKLNEIGTGYTLQYRLDRLGSQLNEIEFVLQNAATDSINGLSYNLNQFAMTEVDYYHNLLSDRFGKIGINIARIPYDHVNEIISTPLGGALYNERMIQNHGQAVFRMRNELTQAVVLGEDTAKAARRLVGLGPTLTGKMGKELAIQSEIIARTEIMRIQNAVGKRIFEENQDVLKGMQHLATLDDRTCLVCGVKDGTIYYFNRNPITGLDTPPLHPRCRCVLVPLSKSWKELGCDKHEPSEGGRPFVYKGIPPTHLSRQMRQYHGDPERWAGQISESLNYDQWLRKMDVEDPAFVRDILGKKRYDLWNSGKLTLNKMVRDNRILRVDELDRISKPKTKGVGAKAKEPWKIRGERNPEEIAEEAGLFIGEPTTNKVPTIKINANDNYIEAIASTQDGKVGFAIATHLKGKDYELAVVIVSPKYHRKGIATKFVNKIRNKIESQGGRFTIAKDRTPSGQDFAKSILVEKGVKAKIKKPLTTTHPEWKLADKINAITMNDFVKSVKAKEWDSVAKHLDDVLVKQSLSTAQHNLNELNIMRYFSEQGMKAKRMQEILGDYVALSRMKLYGKGVGVKVGKIERLPKSIRKELDKIPMAKRDLPKIDQLPELQLGEYKGTMSSGACHRNTLKYVKGKKDTDAYMGFVIHRHISYKYSPRGMIPQYEWRATEHCFPVVKGKVVEITDIGKWDDFYHYVGVKIPKIELDDAYKAIKIGDSLPFAFKFQNFRDKNLIKNWLALQRAEKIFPNRIKSIKPISSKLQAKMSMRQVAAHKNKYIIDGQSRSVAERWERELARKLGAEHSTGSKPFDFFLNNEFIEHKTILQNNRGLAHQLSVEKPARLRKNAFVKKYGIRQHQTAIDMDVNSEHFGQVFYRKDIGSWRLRDMTMVGHIDDAETMVKLKVLLNKGAKKFDTPPIAKAKVPMQKTRVRAENYAKKRFDLDVADYDDLDTDSANLFNQYLKGIADEYQVKPSAVRFDESFFVGKNRELAGLAFEDGTVAFNPRFFKTVDDMVDLVKEQHALDGWFGTASRGHVFRHEIGHQKYFALGGTEEMAGKKLSKKTIVELRKGIGKADMPRFISKYGLTNEGEFYAECFAKMANGEALHPVVKKIFLRMEVNLKKGLAKKVKLKSGIGIKGD